MHGRMRHLLHPDQACVQRYSEQRTDCLPYMQSHIAQYKLAGGDVAECKTMNEDNHTALANLHDVRYLFSLHSMLAQHLVCCLLQAESIKQGVCIYMGLACPWCGQRSGDQHVCR